VARPCACSSDRRQRGAAVRLSIHVARQASRCERLAVRASHAGAGELRREPHAVRRRGASLIVTQRTGGSGALGATIWILARIVYIPIYLFGVVYARTAVWAISIIGLVMMLSHLIVW
jgi:uncharacterized MAPEG superfamily protein